MWYHELGFNVLAIKPGTKHPAHEYTNAPYDYKARRQTEEEVTALPWGEADTEYLGLVCGLGSCNVDFDAVKDDNGARVPVDLEAVTALCEALGLGPSYRWVYRSRSGTGFHLWVRCEENLTEHGIGAGKVDYRPRNETSSFHHFELRWKDVQSLAPVLEAPWVHGKPEAPPALVSARVLLDALEKMGTREPKKSPAEGVVDLHREEVKAELHFVEHASGVVLTKEEKRRTEETVKDQIRARFDLVAYLCSYLGVSSNDVIDAGHEWRIGRPGAGLGGWHVTKDGVKWNTFQDGNGSLGGDCFDAVGHVLFGGSYVKDNGTMWRAVLEEASRVAGVELPTFSVQRARRVMGGGGDYGHVSTDNPTAEKHEERKAKPGRGGKQSTAEDVQEFLSQSFKLRWNTVFLRVEWTMHEEEAWKPISDNAEASWRVSYEKGSGKRVGREAFSDYVRDLAHTNRHDPFTSYFDGLTPYDPAEGDHIARLAGFVPTERSEVFADHLRKWLVGAYACAYYDAKSDGYRNRNELFLVLTGGQGLGKTSFLRFLVPSALGGYLLEKSLKDCKDSEQELAQSFVVLDDELRTFAAREVDSVKALLSKASFSFRPPYGRHPEEFPRRASFCGTTNVVEFFRDLTGSRRFLIHDVTGRVDFDGLKAFDVSRAWAQARHLYNEGFCFFLTHEEQSTVEAHNSDFSAPTAEADLLARYFKPVAWGAENAQYYNTSTLAERISQKHDEEHTRKEPYGDGEYREVRDGVPRFKYDSPAVHQKLGAILPRLGFVRGNRRINGRSVKAWAVYEKPRHEWNLETDEDQNTPQNGGDREDSLF
jgi:hypothetical protein